MPRGSIAFVVGILLALAAGRAAAQPPVDAAGAPSTEAPSDAVARDASSDAASPRRVAVMMLPVEPSQAATADALTELLVGAVVARGDGEIPVGKEEFQALLGQDDAASAACLESAACLGRVAVRLGVAEVVAGTIAERTVAGGSAWAFHLLRLDVQRGETRGRVFREVRGGLPALLDALEEAFPELYVRRVEPGRLVLRADVPGATMTLDGVPLGRFDGAPLRRETVEPGTHRLLVTAAGHRPTARELVVEEGATLMVDVVLEDAPARPLSPLLFVGGATALASITAAAILGDASQARAPATLSMRETLAGFYPAREAEAIAANVLFASAAAGAVVGVVGAVLTWMPVDEGDDAARAAAEGDAPTFAVHGAITPDAAALTLAGTWP